MEFTVVIEYDPEDGSYNASVPSLPGCFAWGKTKAEAIKHIKEVVVLFVEAMEEAGESIPKELELQRVRVG